MIRKAIPTLCIVAFIALAGCRTAPTSPEATQQYCQALGAYAQTVVQLHQLDENATIDDFKNALIATQQAYAGVVEASSQVMDAQRSEIRTATDNLSNAVRDISTSMTVNEAVASVQDELAAVDAAIASASAAVGCSIPTPVPAPTPTTSAVTTAQAQLCTDLAAYEAAVAALESLTGDATIEQVQDAQKAVDDAWVTVTQSAAQVTDVQIENLDQATQNLSRAVNDINDSMTFAEAKESIADEVQAVQAARQELTSSAECQTN